MSHPASLIAAEIRQGGPISFERFMERALYCPETGYYERISHTPGRAGDYFTSVSVGPLFGALLAEQFAHWAAADPDQPCQWVEAGAQDGHLADDLLAWVHRCRPELGRRLEYWIVEPSPRRRAWQASRLAPYQGQVRWIEDLALGPATGFSGVVFANELLDAFPVRRLGWDPACRGWFEWGVGGEATRFRWVRLPITGGDRSTLPVIPEALADVLPQDFTVEVCPRATAWWSQAARCLRHGRLLTFDYGLEPWQQFDPARSRGTLRAYRQHRWGDDLLASPGDQDLTAHVDWDAIRQAGEAAGLQTECLQEQGRFLTGVVAQCPETFRADPAFWTPQRVRQFQTLTHPGQLGSKFQVLLQRRPSGGPGDLAKRGS